MMESRDPSTGNLHEEISDSEKELIGKMVRDIQRELGMDISH